MTLYTVESTKSSSNVSTDTEPEPPKPENPEFGFTVQTKAFPILSFIFAMLAFFIGLVWSPLY